MYGKILRLDSARQNRIDPDGFMQLFSAKAQAALRTGDTKLNSSYVGTTPFNPTLVRQSMYPDFFRGTGLKTLFWKLKNFPDLRELKRVFVNKDNSVVFEFENTVTKENVDDLTRILKGFGHYEFTNPEKSGKRVGYDVTEQAYPEEAE